MTTADPKQSAVAARGGIIPYLALDGAGKAADFYIKAFGADEIARVPGPGNDGRFIHIHLTLNGQSLMLSDPFPEHGHAYREPAGVTLHLQVTDIQRWFDRAVTAGATATAPVRKEFWGDFYGRLRDPFGVEWSMGETPKA
jgi:PhnB protein